MEDYQVDPAGRRFWRVQEDYGQAELGSGAESPSNDARKWIETGQTRYAELVE